MTSGRNDDSFVEDGHVEEALLGLPDAGDSSLRSPAAASVLRRLQKRIKIRGLVGSLRAKEGLARNIAFMVLWQGANYLAPLLTFPHLARVLHPDGFGRFGIALLLAGWMTIVSDWGTNMTGARAIAQAHALGGNIDRPFWNIFSVRILIVIVMLAALLVYISAENVSGLEIATLFAAWSMIVGNALTVSWCLQGLERLDAFATAALIGRLLTVPATIFLVQRSDEVWLAVGIQGVGGILIGLVSIIILYRSGRVGRFCPTLAGIVQGVRDGFPIFVTTASHGLYSSTATMTLGWLHGPAATGIFVAADRIRLAAQNVVQPVGQAIFPRISRLVVTDRTAAVRLVRTLAVIQGLVMTAGCLLLIALSGIVVELLAGKAFAASAPVLRLLALTIVVYATNNVLGRQTLMPFGHDKIFGKIAFATAVFNVVIMPPIVYFGGAEGAALGVLATESFVLACCLIVIKKRRILSLT